MGGAAAGDAGAAAGGSAGKSDKRFEVKKWNAVSDAVRGGWGGQQKGCGAGQPKGLRLIGDDSPPLRADGRFSHTESCSLPVCDSAILAAAEACFRGAAFLRSSATFWSEGKRCCALVRGLHQWPEPLEGGGRLTGKTQRAGM